MPDFPVQEVSPFVGERPHTVCRPRLKCRQLFMIYTGRLGELMLPAFEFIRATQIHDRNMVVFRDNERVNYQGGLSPDIPNMRSFLEWQQMQRELYFPHVHTTYCLGTSAGGYAALASGHYLKAPIVWAFGPMTQIRGRFALYANDAVSQRCTDLAEVLSEDNGVTEYRVFYNEGFDMDREAVERIADCPGVRLFPQSGEGHQVVVTMAETGQLRDLLVPFEAV